MLPGCRVPAHQPFTPWQFAAPEVRIAVFSSFLVSPPHHAFWSQVMDDKEYDGVKSDVWQLGVMMFAIMIKQQGELTNTMSCLPLVY